MMNFDTDAVIKQFVANGVPENQARAIVRELDEAQNELVPKRDMTETLKYANLLKALGVSPAQAEAEAVAMTAVMEVRRDIADLRWDMEARFTQLEQRLIDHFVSGKGNMSKSTTSQD